MSPPQQAVILCGGRGTRLRPLTDTMPKPLVPVNGRPFLEHLIEQIRAQGINRILLLTGYRGEMIDEYFGKGKTLGVEISYSHGPAEWDTGRRIWEAREHLDSRFLLLYSDNFVQFNIQRLQRLHQKHNAPITLLLAPKEKGNIRVSADGRVEAYDKTRSGEGLNYVEVGYMLIERDLVLEDFSTYAEFPNFNFSALLQKFALQAKIAGLVVHDSYHSISDLARLQLMCEYLKPKRILLIDRDGTMNKKAPRGEYISTWEGFKWIPETRQAMREMAARGFKFIVITNQAGVARGMVSAVELDRIHQSMISELHKEGIEILGVYVCPHHWDDNCECRKPKPQMFFRISAEHLLRMDQTIFVGDDVRDREAAVNAGCGSLLIGPTEQCESMGKEPKWTMDARRLSDAVPAIESFFRSVYS